MQEKRDIFDRMMALPILNIFEPFYKKQGSIVVFVFWRADFIVSIATYAVFNVSMGINELIANVMSWVLAVLFAFATNRVWVFQAPTHTITEFLKQMLSFFGGRVVTLVIEEIILLVFITWLGFNSMVVKVIAQVIVIVLNYVISKFFVFSDKNSRQAAGWLFLQDAGAGWRIYISYRRIIIWKG